MGSRPSPRGLAPPSEAVGPRSRHCLLSMVVKIDEVIFNNSRCQLHRTLQMLIITTVISLEDKIKIVANTPKALGTG